MTFTYTPITPQGSHFPANDRPLMTANFQYLQNFGNRDHEFTLLSGVNTQDGTHRQVTLNDQASTGPGFTGASSALFSSAVNAVSQLFFQNSGGIVQLTDQRANIPTLLPNGGTYIPGGLLMIWGSGSGTTGSLVNFHTVLQNPTFSGPALFVVLNPNTTGGGFAIGASTLTANGFTLGNMGGSGVNNTFTYLAIGPA